MNALAQLHQLADKYSRLSGFFVSVSTAYHASGDRYVSVMIFSSGQQIAHLYGSTEAEAAEQLTAFIATQKQEHAA